jgi:hypothetical protein
VFLAVDLRSDWRDLMGGGERGAAAGVEGGDSGAAIATAWCVRRYNALFSKREAPESRGGDGDRVHAVCAVGEGTMRHSPWPAAEGLAGARGHGSRGHQTRKR